MAKNRAKCNRFPKSMKKKALKQANYTCKECGSSLDMRTADPHHKIPVSQGGETTRENLLIVCRECHIKLHTN